MDVGVATEAGLEQYEATCAGMRSEDTVLRVEGRIEALGIDCRAFGPKLLDAIAALAL